ncbi:glycoside hydrolase/phage tail family protein [Sedimentitalea sp. JM2-8]|uniref:Glycoside hydrolase/phage tail family protein n=1 Tax=Sedimentitalea xiamensis TaxID=3050037 RepID=A0ABT7FCV8_9RHOB|nr:glycoside hydrolase/phage tail family protein [Sedimentitalea xiamensis]MDK3072954.1 glycoside hydrolase/phage tail family protein [Sedimentitalea xiamensis]
MATILLSAAGAAIGGSIGGSVAGLSSVVIGRAVGATLGQAIDQRLLGQGATAVETGRVDRFRLTNAGEGNPIAQVYGRTRVGGQVIWSSDFRESSSTTDGGGKGSPSTPEVTTFSYSVSLAVAVCEGEINSIGRVWADGTEVSKDDLNMRVYPGSRDQPPDPTMEAVEGRGNVPAYRGTAYIVFDNLPLGKFGNRVPQFSFEVIRTEQESSRTFERDLPQLVRGVALMPGTGEYALATSPVYYTKEPGSSWPANINSPSGKTDFVTSMEMLADELPKCDAASLVVSWFGDDLRCGYCQVQPKFERREVEGSNMPWSVSGRTRSTALEIAEEEGRPIYGGTPADKAVIEAIRHMNAQDRRVMFYPFILMDQTSGNGLPDPWTGAENQPVLPWRGRITLSAAPGTETSPDGTEAADAEVQKLFGKAKASDFKVVSGNVSYHGPQEWGLRRFILHYAALCAAAGGVSSFCIGSEMRSLTQIRGANGFPAVSALKELAGEVRKLVGSETKIGYAADWSEYFGYQPQDGSGNRYFHLDPLWADENIDFIGIDNYMPLSDWRDGADHADSEWESVYNPEYLQKNIEGGEGYDWHYHSSEARSAQIRTEISDLEHGEPWVWRYKDLRSWWSKPHHERIDGVRQVEPTAWVPQSKPIWFTELGCAAVDKGTNEPNKFVDPKSSESSLPSFSNGMRDDFMQMQFLQTVLAYWQDGDRNPNSDLYDGKMVDVSNAYVWAWDTRPYPMFPNNRMQWDDGANYARGHWINGRVGTRSLASVVEEICARSGLTKVDTKRLFGVIPGYVVEQIGDARGALQPLMLRFGFDAVERDGLLIFATRNGNNSKPIDLERVAECDEIEGILQKSRDAEAEMTGRVRVRFIQSGADYDLVAEEAVMADDATHAVSTNDLPLSMTRAEGRQVAERWLAEARVSRDRIRLALPPSMIGIGAGDVIRVPDCLESGEALFRIDMVEQSGLQIVDAVRVERNIYTPSDMADDQPAAASFVPPAQVFPLMMDLPLIAGDEVPHAPHLAVTAQPWPGAVAVYSSVTDDSYDLNRIIRRRSIVGRTETALASAGMGVWDNGEALQVKLLTGGLESKSEDAVLKGANLAAIGDGSSGNWELFQFQSAELIAERTYLLWRRLRGQLGSDAAMKDVWPAGSWFVLMNSIPEQIDLKSAQRRLESHFRIGPAAKGISDPSFSYLREAFDGNGLRPYSPCHLSVNQENGEGIDFKWIRRTRIDGDPWDLTEVPLGEEREAYVVRVAQGSKTIREAVVSKPNWTYSHAQRMEDALLGSYEVSVAQVSALYGAGPYTSIQVT